MRAWTLGHYMTHYTQNGRSYIPVYTNESDMYCGLIEVSRTMQWRQARLVSLLIDLILSLVIVLVA